MVAAPLLALTGPAYLLRSAHLSKGLSWADVARVPRAGLRAQYGLQITRCTGRRSGVLAVTGNLLLSREHHPCASVDAAQLPQRGLQLPKRHDETWLVALVVAV